MGAAVKSHNYKPVHRKMTTKKFILQLNVYCVGRRCASVRQRIILSLFALLSQVYGIFIGIFLVVRFNPIAFVFMLQPI